MYDVISLPAGPTQVTIERYLVHAHPHPRPYRPARLIALRQSGGVMHRLYRTEREIVLFLHEALAPQVERLSCSQQERVLAYIEERRASFGFDEGEEYKFYLLEVAYELRHSKKQSALLAMNVRKGGLLFYVLFFCLMWSAFDF